MMGTIREISHEDFVNGEIVKVKYNDINDKYYGCINDNEIYTYTEEKAKNDMYILVTLDNFQRRLEKLMGE